MMPRNVPTRPSTVRARFQSHHNASGVLDRLDHAPPIAIALGSLLLLALIAFIDYQSGTQLSLALFYLIPIGLSAWYVGRWFGLLVVTVAGVAWTANELMEFLPDYAWMLYWNIVIRVALFLIVASLLSSLRLQLQEVSMQASTDPLTGLFNRRYLYARIQDEIHRAQRYRHPLTLVCIDIDDFKKLNDRHGHQYGDAVLQGLGEVLHGHTRQSDVPARIGGDEFAVLLVETDARMGRDAAEKLQQALRTHLAAPGPTATFSLGAVTFLEPPLDIDQMFRLADEQLYRAKNEGKDQLALIVSPGPGHTAG